LILHAAARISVDTSASKTVMSNYQVTSGVFGSIGEETVQYHSIVGNNGVGFTVTEYGATLISVVAPDRNGNSEEVTLNYRTLDEMITNHGPYYGCIAGRVANRIAKGAFTVDGTKYTVAVNNGQNHLHGGLKGFDQVIWKATPYSDEANGIAGVELRYTSADGEEGYPGTLEVLRSFLYLYNHLYRGQCS
jgi:aldose 1-epimerase